MNVISKMTLDSAWQKLLLSNDIPVSIKLVPLDIDGDPLRIRRKFHLNAIPAFFVPGNLRLWALLEEFEEMFDRDDLLESGIDVFEMVCQNVENFSQNIRIKELRRIFFDTNKSSRCVPSHNLAEVAHEKSDMVIADLFDDWIDDHLEMPYPDVATKEYLLAIELIKRISLRFDEVEWQELISSPPMKRTLCQKSKTPKVAKVAYHKKKDK